jgi:hypothetical protein
MRPTEPSRLGLAEHPTPEACQMEKQDRTGGTLRTQIRARSLRWEGLKYPAAWQGVGWGLSDTRASVVPAHPAGHIHTRQGLHGAQLAYRLATPSQPATAGDGDLGAGLRRKACQGPSRQTPLHPRPQRPGRMVELGQFSDSDGPSLNDILNFRQHFPLFTHKMCFFARSLPFSPAHH